MKKPFIKALIISGFTPLSVWAQNYYDPGFYANSVGNYQQHSVKSEFKKAQNFKYYVGFDYNKSQLKTSKKKRDV